MKHFFAQNVEFCLQKQFFSCVYQKKAVPLYDFLWV